MIYITMTEKMFLNVSEAAELMVENSLKKNILQKRKALVSGIITNLLLTILQIPYIIVLTHKSAKEVQ